MWTARQIKTLPALTYVAAQLLGAWAAYYLYVYFVKTSLQPIGGHYDGRILVAEAVGALILALAYASAVFNQFWQAKLAATVGTSYMLAIIIASAAAVGIVNPAVALSLRAFNPVGSMGWATYALGPVLGSIIGFNLYALLFAPESGLLKVRAAMAGRLNRAETASSAAPTKTEPKDTAAVASSDDSKRSATKRANRSSKKRKNTKK
jgi:glycerol uptake facilitator-like aquaporin